MYPKRNRSEREPNHTEPKKHTGGPKTGPKRVWCVLRLTTRVHCPICRACSKHSGKPTEMAGAKMMLIAAAASVASLLGGTSAFVIPSQVGNTQHVFGSHRPRACNSKGARARCSTTCRAPSTPDRTPFFVAHSESTTVLLTIMPDSKRAVDMHTTS